MVDAAAGDQQDFLVVESGERAFQCRRGEDALVAGLQESTDKEYMMNFSGRYRELHGVTVRTDTPEHFMDDLKKYGYIKG